MFVVIIIFFILETISILAYLRERQNNEYLSEEYEQEKKDLLIKHGKEIEDNIIIYTKIIDSVRSDNYILRKRIKELEDELNKIKSEYVNVENELVENESFIFVTLLEMLNKYKFCKDHKEITELIGETASKIKLFFSKKS